MFRLTESTNESCERETLKYTVIDAASYTLVTCVDLSQSGMSCGELCRIAFMSCAISFKRLMSIQNINEYSAFQEIREFVN